MRFRNEDTRFDRLLKLAYVLLRDRDDMRAFGLRIYWADEVKEKSIFETPNARKKTLAWKPLSKDLESQAASITLRKMKRFPERWRKCRKVAFIKKPVAQSPWRNEADRRQDAELSEM